MTHYKPIGSNTTDYDNEDVADDDVDNDDADAYCSSDESDWYSTSVVLISYFMLVVTS